MTNDPQTFDVVVSDACADTAAELFSLDGREAAREWVLRVITDEGEVVEVLPAVFEGLESPSGWFVVAGTLLALPLASEEDRLGRGRWVATECFGAPRDHVIDPFALEGSALLEQISFPVQVVERFQRRGGGPADAVVARRHLIDALAADARAERVAPEWWDTPDPAEFYLVAGDGDEFCVPCRAGEGVSPYTATTFVHRANGLFALSGMELGARCRADPARFPAGGAEERRLFRLLAKGSRLSWDKPEGVPAEGRAKWWVVAAGIAAPVAWEPGDPARPLVVLGITDMRSWWRRLLG